MPSEKQGETGSPTRGRQRVGDAPCQRLRAGRFLDRVEDEDEDDEDVDEDEEDADEDEDDDDELRSTH